MKKAKKGIQQNKNGNAKISNAQGLSPKNLWKEGLESLNKKDYTTAFFKFAAAANKDYSNAQFELGNLFLEGKGCTKNTSSAFYWYEKAAKAENSLALKKLKELSEKGILQAKSIFEKYAKKPNDVSQQKTTSSKTVVSQHKTEKTYDLYEKAVNGNDEALQKLVELAKSGNNEALRLLEKLPERSRIQFKIGEVYYDKKDFDKACVWYEKSARQGNEEALQKLVELAKSGNEKALQSLEILPQSNGSDIQFALSAVQVPQKIVNKNMDNERAKAKMGDEQAQYLLLLYNLDKCLENFDNMYYKMVISFYDKLKSHINLTHLDALIKVCEQKKIEYDRQSQYGVPTYRSNTTYTPYIDTGESSEAHAFRDFGKFGSYPLYDSDEEIESDEFDF